MKAPTQKKFTAKVKGGPKYTFSAMTEKEALHILMHQYRVDIYKLEYLTDQPIDVDFVAQVGNKDYTVSAPTPIEALRAFALMGLDMSKLTNLRKR